MARLYLILLLATVTLLPQCLASHFRGAIISYRKEDSNDGQIHLAIDYRIAWRRSEAAHFCDKSTIASGHLNTEGTLDCLSNCPGILGNMKYQCTDFSVDEDWTAGRGHIDAILPASVSSLYDFGFRSCCWIGSLEHGSGGGWELRVRANLTNRLDTGMVNNPPGSDIAPIVRLQSGCNNTIRIPVYDADGDTVRCRWAIGNECSAVCSAFPDAILNEETCTITYQSRNMYESGTWYAVALQIEDFVQYSSRSQPLSSIPLQFLVNVFHSGVGCEVGSKPVFSESTLPDQSCLTIPTRSNFTTNITVISRDNSSIAEIQTISPIGMIKGPLEQSTWNSSVWTMTVSWSPQQHHASNNLFCYTAITSLGITSEKRCINLLDESLAPQITGFNNDVIQETFSVEFDKSFSMPTVPTFIRIYNPLNNSQITEIDVTDPYMVHINGNTLEFNISTTLQPGLSYRFHFDKGLVRGTTYCRLPSSPWDMNFNASTPIRLVNGTRPSKGRVEIYTENQWKTVCMRPFTRNDALFICRGVGYQVSDNMWIPVNDSRHPNNTEGEGGIIDYPLGCQGYETDLVDCNRIYSTYSCNHSDDVWIDCGFIIRLAGGNTSNSGIVELYYNNTWTTLSKHNFGGNEARAVCRTLGYSLGRVNNESYHGTLNISEIGELFCNGHEEAAGQCWFNPISYTPFYRQDAAVECGTQIRLVNGTSPYSGRVEVKYRDKWGTVCDDEFDVLDAKVICEMLGYYVSDSYLQAYHSARFGTGSGSIVIDDLHCSGNETDISECISQPWLSHNCGHSEDASVDCQYGYYISMYQTTVPTSTVRLVNGRDRYSGRVEVWYNGQWGSICDDSFDHSDVKVICRILGMNFGDGYGVAYSGAYFGQSSGPIVIDDLNCYGNEYALQSCNSNVWGSHNCQHTEDAGIDCRAQVGSGMYNSTSYYTGYTTKYTTGYRRTTYPYWLTTNSGYRLEDAFTVGCNENGWNVRVDMNILRQIYPNALAGDIYLGENSCTGTDRGYDVIFQQGLSDCLTTKVTINNNLVYRNQVIYAEHDPTHPFIIRQFNWTVSIECDVGRNQTSTGHLHHDANTNTGHHVSGSSEYAVNMTFYSDPNFRYQLQGNPLHVQVGQNVYAKVFSTTSDWTVKMRLHTCYTKPDPNAADNLNFYIIQDGCEVDVNTHIMSQSTHETRFVFKDFQYTSYSEGIYVFCHATFCDTSDYSRTCTQACNPVARRSHVIASENRTDISTTTQLP